MSKNDDYLEEKKTLGQFLELQVEVVMFFIEHSFLLEGTINKLWNSTLDFFQTFFLMDRDCHFEEKNLLSRIIFKLPSKN